MMMSEIIQLTFQDWPKEIKLLFGMCTLPSNPQWAGLLKVA